jgi:hypothetical protein
MYLFKRGKYIFLPVKQVVAGKVNDAGPFHFIQWQGVYFFFIYAIIRQKISVNKIPSPVAIIPKVCALRNCVLKTNICSIPFENKIKASRPVTKRKVLVHCAGFLVMYNLFSSW